MTLRMPLEIGYDRASEAMGTVHDLKGYGWEPRNDSGISEITLEIALELALKRFPFMFHRDEYKPPQQGLIRDQALLHTLMFGSMLRQEPQVLRTYSHMKKLPIREKGISQATRSRKFELR
jgi:hypothetical protein